NLTLLPSLTLRQHPAHTDSPIAIKSPQVRRERVLAEFPVAGLCGGAASETAPACKKPGTSRSPDIFKAIEALGGVEKLPAMKKDRNKAINAAMPLGATPVHEKTLQRFFKKHPTGQRAA